MPNRRGWPLTVSMPEIRNDQSDTPPQEGDLPSSQAEAKQPWEAKHPSVDNSHELHSLGKRRKPSSIIFTALFDLFLSSSAIMFFVLAAYASHYDKRQIDGNGEMLLEAAQLVCWTSTTVLNNSKCVARVLRSFL